MPRFEHMHRFATLADMQELLDLQDRALRDLTTQDYTPKAMERFRTEVGMVTPDLIEEGHYLVLTNQHGRIIASGGWSQQTPAYAAALSQHDNDICSGTAIVRSMFVSPEMARRGLGRRVLQLLEADAKTHGITHLTLTATKTGIPLYRACGFTGTAIAEVVLSDGAVIYGMDMEKPLTISVGPDIALNVAEARF